MLSVDLHHVGGYKCDLCGSGYEAKLGNIVMCGDKLLYEFIEWCKTQDFYKDTTIVIIGDHPRMDTQLVKGVDFYERTMYNCIINPAIDAPKNFQNRVFTSLDMFPTVLAAMGFEIEGERLGLGTNLFSPVPTLCEKNGKGREGYDWLDTEVIKRSDYYKKHFVDDKD
jgi:phosphoglycerol transferase